MSKIRLEDDPNTRIILCFGFREGTNRDQAGVMGIKGYCEKPMSIESLLSDISGILL